VAYSKAFTWNNPEMKSLEDQALVPLFGDHPVELGLKQDDSLAKLLRSDPRYPALFEKAFADAADRFTVANVTRAIASFERSIISARSPYDRYHYYREDEAVSESAKRGEAVFFRQDVHCFRCHGGFNFSSATFHNTGVTEDRGQFKAPTLRNIALTAPYMHDGSIATLDAVLDHYAAGGRVQDNPAKDPLIGGFSLTAGERHDLIEFLRSLTDEAVLRDPRFSNPW
jgi:cytochrome c peroxidase